MTKHLVLDANILIRAVLGTRVAAYIQDYAATVVFLTVEEAFEDAATYLPEVLARRGVHDVAIQVARQYDIRLMGPNIYGFYSTPENLCATFCTPYDEKGQVALSSQSGGVGMAIIDVHSVSPVPVVLSG